MKNSLRTGLGFGLTSGSITTLGLIVGLYSGTHSRLAVIGGVLTIALADACADAVGIHVSEEFKNNHSVRDVWEATIFTFACKFIVALSYLIPLFIFSLRTAVGICIVWGLVILTVFSIYIAMEQKKSPLKAVVEHLSIAIFVVVASHYLQGWISRTFF